MSTINDVCFLVRGDLVRARKRLDPEGADVFPGDYGVVFEPANYHETGSGPMVRWFSGGVCNIYDGDVWRVNR